MSYKLFPLYFPVATWTGLRSSAHSSSLTSVGEAHCSAPRLWGLAHYLVVAGQEGELLGLQELCLGDVQAILPIQELHHTAVAVTDREIILHNQPLQVLDDAPVRTPSAQSPLAHHLPGRPLMRVSGGGGEEKGGCCSAGTQDFGTQAGSNAPGSGLAPVSPSQRLHFLMVF